MSTPEGVIPIPAARIRHLNMQGTVSTSSPPDMQALYLKSLEARRKKTAETKARVIEALGDCLGIVKFALKKVGVNRRTFYEWCHSDPAFKEEIDHIDEDTLDFAEAKLLQNIKNGDKTSIIFFLKTKGKKRGYVERTEFSVDGGKPLDTSGNISIADLKQEVPDSTLKAIIQRIVDENNKANGNANSAGATADSPIAVRPGGQPGGASPTPRTFGKSVVSSKLPRIGGESEG